MDLLSEKKITTPFIVTEYWTWHFIKLSNFEKCFIFKHCQNKPFTYLHFLTYNWLTFYQSHKNYTKSIYNFNEVFLSSLSWMRSEFENRNLEGSYSTLNGSILNYLFDLHCSSPCFSLTLLNSYIWNFFFFYDCLILRHQYDGTLCEFNLDFSQGYFPKWRWLFHPRDLISMHICTTEPRNLITLFPVQPQMVCHLKQVTKAVSQFLSKVESSITKPSCEVCSPASKEGRLWSLSRLLRALDQSKFENC